MGNIKEPEQMDWDNYNPGSNYQAPPPALDDNGDPIIYFATVPTEIPSTVNGKADTTKEGYAQWQLDPLVLVDSSLPALTPKIKGYKVRFASVNTKKFLRDGKPTNASSIGNFLRSAKVSAKPQTNQQYEQAMTVAKGRTVSVVLDWTARNKDTNEEIRGYKNFPLLDPSLGPNGPRKAILKRGDTYTAPDGSTMTVQSEVLFANARVRYYTDSNKK
jgi:hypothetical protein